MALHPQAQQFLDIVAGAPPLDTQTAEQNRADLVQAVALTGERVPVTAVEDRTIDGEGGPIAVRLYRPHPDTRQPALAYFHGGGWTLGDLELADSTCRALAVHGDATVVSVNYRLAPKYPFPAALNDALAVTRALLDGAIDGIDPGRVAVGGDSAGGNLAAVTAQQLRGAGLRHQVLIYPVTQARVGATPSYRDFGDGHYLTARDMQYFFDCYAADVDPDDPRLSPSAAADLTGLAPATVVTAERDPLRDEGEAYAERLRSAGVDVTTRRFDGQVHPFFYLAGVIDDAAAARRFVGERLRQSLHTD